MATISGLFVYPLKSAGGVSLTEAVVLPHGLGIALQDSTVMAVDRMWCVVDQDGESVVYPSRVLLGSVSY